MEIDEIVDYATKTPENTNPAVLRSMLGQLSGGSGGEVFWVTITLVDGTLVSDKTAEEIYNAVMAGQYVRGKYVEEHSIEYIELNSTAANESGGYVANFTCTSYDATQRESGYGYGTEYLIASSRDYVTVAYWTWEVKDYS